MHLMCACKHTFTGIFVPNTHSCITLTLFKKINKCDFLRVGKGGYGKKLRGYGRVWKGTQRGQVGMETNIAGTGGHGIKFGTRADFYYQYFCLLNYVFNRF